MRALTIYILIGALCSSVAFADSSSLKLTAVREAEQEIADLKSPYVPVSVPRGTRNPGFVAHYLAQAVVVGVAVANAKRKIEDERGYKFTPEETRQLIEVTAAQMITNLQTSSTVLAMHQTNRIMAPVTAALMRPAETSTALKLLKLALARQIAMPVGMAASSLVSELFTRAIKRLPPKDQEKGQNLVFALYRASQASDKAAALADEGRVLGQIMANMGDIAILNQDERNRWLYDTWRNDIATGKFVTGSAAVGLGATAGGALGSAVPFVGTGFGSMLGGSAGLLVALNVVPNSTQDKITEAMINARKSTLLNRLKSCMERTENTYRLSESASFNRIHNIGENDLLRPLNACEKLREGYLTIVMDQTKNIYSQMTVLRNRIASTQADNPNADINQMKMDLLKAGMRLHQLEGDAVDFYSSQSQAFEHLSPKFKNTQTSTLLAQESSRLAKISAQLKATYAKLPEDHDANVQVFAASIDGFRENDWLTDPSLPASEDSAPTTDASQ